MEHPLSQPTVAHIDVNSAFLSWSATRRLLDEPDATDLRDIPSAVGGDIERRHGIILAKSIPAKKYGVTTGEPVVKALRKCPSLVLVKPDFHLYSEYSRAFIAILRKYSPVIEQLSVDEAFVELTGSELLYPSALDVVYRIKDEIRDTLGFTVNVGLSSNKLLAKMASDFEKPDRVHTLYPEEIAEKMWPLPIGDLYGVGHSAEEKLKKLGIKTIGDAAAFSRQQLQKLLGGAFGDMVYERSNGIDPSRVNPFSAPAKSYGNSTTLREDITAENRARLLAPTLLALSDSVAARMRRDGASAHTVSVTLKTADFVTHSRQTTLRAATDGTNELYEVALELAEQLWDGKTAIRLVGISAGNLDEGNRQICLFDEDSPDKRTKQSKLDAATDGIRGRFGKSALTRGTLLDSPSEKKPKKE